AELLLKESDPKRIDLAGVALFFDAGLSVFEGWALRRGHWWAPWVVVIASSCLVPLEIYEIIAHVAVGRVAILLLNLLLVFYLSRRAWHEHQERRGHTGSPH